MHNMYRPVGSGPVVKEIAYTDTTEYMNVKIQMVMSIADVGQHRTRAASNTQAPKGYECEGRYTGGGQCGSGNQKQ